MEISSGGGGRRDKISKAAPMSRDSGCQFPGLKGRALTPFQAPRASMTWAVKITPGSTVAKARA